MCVCVLCVPQTSSLIEVTSSLFEAQAVELSNSKLELQTLTQRIAKLEIEATLSRNKDPAPGPRFRPNP